MNITSAYNPDINLIRLENPLLPGMFIAVCCGDGYLDRKAFEAHQKAPHKDRWEPLPKLVVRRRTPPVDAFERGWLGRRVLLHGESHQVWAIARNKRLWLLSEAGHTLLGDSYAPSDVEPGGLGPLNT